MNWIETVRLENFQSHLDTMIDFHQGLNVIVGQSDSGKTAIFRAIRWALYNLPRGSDFIRVGADFVRVTVTFANGVTIIRERTASKNRYILKEAGKEDLIFEGFGVHVPKEILDAHGMKPLRIERDLEMLLHLSEQLDGPFLLEQSPAIRAKTIGRISGAHYLDMAIRDTTKDLQKLKQQISYTESEKERLLEQLKPFAFLDEAKRQLSEATNCFQLLQQQMERKKKLVEWKKKHEAILTEKTQWQKQYEFVSKVDQWETNVLKLTNLYERYLFYQRRLEEEQQLNKNIEVCKLWIEKTKYTNLAEQRLQEIVAILRRLQVLQQFKNELQRIEDSKNKTMAILIKTSFATNERVELIKQLEMDIEKTETLKMKKREYEHTTMQIAQCQTMIHKLAKVELAASKLQMIEVQRQRYETLKEKQQSLTGLENQIKKGYQFLEQKQQEEEQLKHQYERALSKQGTCPICGNDIDQNKLKSLLE